MEVAVLFSVFVGGLVLGIPVAITLGLSSLAYLLLAGIPPVVMPQKMYAGMDVFVLLSIPGFILAGNLMNRGGITQRIIRFANSLVGWIKGGLGLTNIAASMLFVGMFMEAIAALIILFVPLLSLAQAVGIEPLHFATFAVLNLMIGLTTPPVGVCLFVCAGIARLPLMPVVVAILPFLLTNIAVLLAVSYIPALATWLPSLLTK
ncbi:TRAP transporter large permease subunit [Primorskyibacter aestuariivivens]|uniref:TRAP transporter large permease subunit n=1 Tax=Primorskyibacter aestuariivivens TaxID=1888912 RepID=UPI0023019BE2|nr:TRAP transporter large permease subunit [Primorskyibacter aestuariivivens]MDA7430936.1 TRAP transporter large permease subunit [Primorskyibacter aestuariivivens]